MYAFAFLLQFLFAGILSERKSSNTAMHHNSKIGNLNLNSNSLLAKSESEISYCVCLSTRLQRCIEEKNCDAYSIDMQNYVSHNNATFLDYISNNTLNGKFSTVNLYITNSKINLKMRDFRLAQNVSYNFIVSDFSYQSAVVEIKSSLMTDSSASDDFIVSATFQGLSEIIIDQTASKKFNKIELKNSPINFEAETLSVKKLTTDSASLSRYTQKLLVTEELKLTKATFPTLSKNIFINSSCSLIVEKISNFPVLSLNSKDLNFILEMSDSYEDFTINIFMNGANDINFTDDVSTNLPTIVFYNKINNPITKTDIEFNFRFLVKSNGLSLNFAPYFNNKINSFPNGIKFSFEKDEVGNDELDSVLQLYLGNIEKDTFPFESMNGQFNIQLMSFSTIQEIFKMLKKDEKEKNLIITNLESLTMNFENILNEIKFEDDDKVTFNENISFGSSITKAFYIVSASAKIELVNETKSYIPKITIVTKEASNIHIKNKFINEELIQNFSVLHYEFPLNVSIDKNDQQHQYIPLINIIDKVTNVSYHNGDDGVQTINIDDDVKDISILRAGPNVKYNIMKQEINFNQSIALAQKVTFFGNDFNFIYENESICNYKFNQNINIDSTNSDGNVINLKMKSAVFSENSAIDQKTAKLLNATFETLVLNKISSVPMKSFIEPIKIKESFEMNDTDKQIKRIYFSENSVRFGDESVRIKKIIKDSFFQINTNQDEKIVLSFEGNIKATLSNLNLTLSGGQISLFVDKSWYKVTIDDSFKITFPENTIDIHLETELLEFPNFKFYLSDGSDITERFNVQKHKPNFTSSKAFYIIMGVLGAVCVIAIVCCVIGLCVIKKPEDVDYTDQDEEAGLME